MTINLIVEEKYQKRNDKTPKRKKLAAAFDSKDSDDDGIFVDMSTFNNNAAGPSVGGGGIGIGSCGGYGGGGCGYTTSGGFGGSGFSGGLGQARGRSNASARNHNRNSSMASNTNISMGDDDSMSFGADSTSTPTNANCLNAGGFDDNDSVGDDL